MFITTHKPLSCSSCCDIVMTYCTKMYNRGYAWRECIEKDSPTKMWLKFVKTPSFQSFVLKLIRISLPNFCNIWNHISSSIWTQKCGSTEFGLYKNDYIKLCPPCRCFSITLLLNWERNGQCGKSKNARFEKC